MDGSRIRVGLAVLATLVASSGCGTSPSNSAATRNDQNAAAEVATADNAQNVAEPIVPKMPPAPDLSTVEGRTEAAIINELSCKSPVEAAKVVNAMLKNGLLKESDDTGDGSFVYVPTRQLSVLGFPLVRVIGWQMMENGGDGVPPFIRVPGTPPGDHLAVTVRASLAGVRSAIAALGIREEGWRPDPAQISIEIDGKWYRPHRQIPGMRIEEGDLSGVKRKLNNVTTLSCHTDERSFMP